MKTIETQGRDGSPQLSQVSGETHRHPKRLRLKNRASRRSAPTFPPLRASAPPREISLCVASFAPAHVALRVAFGRLPGQRLLARVPVSTFRFPVSSSAFTLLEVLVATAVLALMMTFLFNLLGSSAKLWETSNKKIEAAQAARMGLNIMANDLKNAFSGNMTAYTTNGTSSFNVAPFLAESAPTFAVSTSVSSTYAAQNSPGSQRLSCVTLIPSSTSNPYQEVQYQSIYLGSHYGEMRGNRYYLVRGYQDNGGANGNFYFRGSVNTTWAAGGSGFLFENITDNCIRLKLQYYGNESSPTGAPGWTSNGSWTPQDRLPLGVLVTLTVLDSKTAEKIAAIKGSAAVLTLQEIDNGLSSSPPATLTAVERLIAQGSVTMSRFIPFNSQ